MFSIVMFFKSYPRMPIPLHASSVKSLNTMLLEPLDNLQYEEYMIYWCWLEVYVIGIKFELTEIGDKCG